MQEVKFLARTLTKETLQTFQTSFPIHSKLIHEGEDVV